MTKKVIIMTKRIIVKNSERKLRERFGLEDLVDNAVKTIKMGT